VNSALERGKRGERELVSLLRDLTGWPVRRALGNGRHDDAGDLHGLPDCVAQVKNYADITRAIREALDELPTQQAIAGTPYGVALVRRPGGRWIAAMDVPMFVSLLREATG
jgi:hypothetical protein